MTAFRLILTCAILPLASLARGVSWELFSEASLMQQPSSQYYHAAYGLSGGINLFNERILLHGRYLERPKFRNHSFSEQEFGGFGFLGTTLNGPIKLLMIRPYIGYGQMSGYVAARDEQSDLPLRRYKIAGPSFTVDLHFALNAFRLALFHQTFVGIKGPDESNAKVAWPFSYYGLKIGMAL